MKKQTLTRIFGFALAAAVVAPAAVFADAGALDGFKSELISLAESLDGLYGTVTRIALIVGGAIALVRAIAKNSIGQVIVFSGIVLAAIFLPKIIKAAF